MKANHPQSSNLFSRLTRFTADEGSNRIENFCTEALAWCLLASPTFLQGFLRQLGLPNEACDIHTQYSYALDETSDANAAKNKGLFDLLLTSKESTNFAVIIEVKVWSGFGPKQPEKYKAAKKKGFREFKRPILVSITPFSDKHEAFDDHIQWWQIEHLLENTTDTQGIQLMLRQLATYLKDRGLGMATLDPINPKILNDWHRFAAVQAQWDSLFAMFGMDPELKKIFKKAVDHPYAETDTTPLKKTRSWIGISSANTLPSFYAGLGIMETNETVLWVEVGVSEKVAKAKNRLPANLKRALQAATKRLDKKTDLYVNFGKVGDDGRTSFAFFQPLAEGFDGKPEKILDWFKTTIMSARDFVATESKKRTPR